MRPTQKRSSRHINNTSARTTKTIKNKTLNTANHDLEQKARKFRGLYNEMVQEHEFPCEVAFNVILLLMRCRDAYLFERRAKSELPLITKIINYIETIKPSNAGKPKFQFLFLKSRFNHTKTQKITKEEYLADHPKYDLILYRNGDRKTQQILDQDTISVEFGKLLKLVCAADLREFYKHKMYQRGQPHGGQIRYYIDCAGQKSYFMIQMCPAVASPETQKLLTDDISQYQAIGRGLGIQTIGWYSPKMGKLEQGILWLLSKYLKIFTKKKPNKK